MKSQATKFFQFLEKKENRQVPLRVKLLNPREYTISPKELDVKGELDLNNTPLTSLPNNLKVGGYLALSRTKITSLPDNLTVGGSLLLRRTPLTSLPNNLKVGGNLIIEHTPLAKKYSDEQIRSMVEKKGGFVNKKIYV